MARFVANINDGSYINLSATKMDIKEDMIYVYNEDRLVALVDISVILTARIDE